MDHVRHNERDRLERTDTRTLPGGGRGEAYEHQVVREMDPDTLREGRGGGGAVGDARERSFASLFKELRDELATLFRQEIALAKTEMSEKASKTGRDVASIGAGAAFLLSGLIVVLFGIAALLYWILTQFDMSNYHAGWIAPVAVGALAALIGWGMVKAGTSAIKRRSIVPEKTVESLKEDKQWLTNQTK